MRSTFSAMSLLPGALDGENEFMVLGGYYRVTRVR
jgi:hypothetical protein